MRIVNNKIYIARGETPTYSASIIDKETGAPLIIDKGLFEGENTLILEFVVRDSVYSRNEDLRIKRSLLIEENPGFHVFDSTEVVPYERVSGVELSDEWDNDYGPLEGYENCLYRRTDNYEENHYAYYENGKWVEYSFDFDVTFTHDETSVMEPKTYKYQITLLGGPLKTNPESWETIVDVVYFKPILDLTDFVVEGSISE